MSISIQESLQTLCDPQYQSFQQKLLPTVAPERILGVRTPDLRRLAKELIGTDESNMLLSNLPHRLFEENQLHAFILSAMKDFGQCLSEVTRFLPYVDNWATCDQLSPRCFGRHKKELMPHIERWMQSGHEYSVRFGIGMLMQHYLDADFHPHYLDQVAAVHRDEYYVQMMQAWFFATALAKQYEATLPYLEQRRLERWTHNKSIQKAIESFRVTEEHKNTLRTLRWK